MVDLELIARLRRRLSTEVSVLTGLSAEIVEASRRASVLAAQAHQAKEHASRYVAADDMTQMSPEDAQVYFNAKAAARFAERQRVISQAREVGVDPQPLLLQLQQFHDETDRSAEYHAAARDAEAAHRRAEQQLLELEAERAARGRNVGELRASLQRFDLWARTNGHTELAA